MISEIVLAAALGLGIAMLCGVINKGLLGIRSAANFVVQELTVLYFAVSVVGNGLPLIAGIVMIAMPVLLHTMKIMFITHANKKAARGDYGECAQWTHELVDEGDEEFKRAAAALSDMDIREVNVLADTKEEYREYMIERYEERLDEAGI